MKKLIFHNPFLIFYLISCCFVVSYALVSFRCLSDQSSALLQLKEEFGSNKPNSSDASHSNNMVMDAWNVSTDCCFWSGVRCNMTTGRVLSLNLSKSGLRGPLKANSSLFSLDQLQQLNLAFNNFSSSQISSRFGQLSRLTHLNLSNSVFSGNIPPEFSLLVSLVSLDLSNNYLCFEKRIDMENLIQNMKHLRELHLDGVNFYSSVPESLVNLSSLTSLSLSGCSLGGEFPKDIFQLPNIQAIDVSYNDDLTVFLPHFGSDCSFRQLDFSFTNFVGKVPNSIGHLKSLNVLSLRGCLSLGKLPDSIGHLKSLNVLDLSSCALTGTIPSWVGNLSQLTGLDISNNNFDGHLPIVLRNLSQLTNLDLSNNQFDGQHPFSLGNNLAKLTVLELGSNQFRGRIPSSIGNLSQLIHLDLSYNLFHGEFPIAVANLTQLLSLDLSGNQFTGPTPPNIFENFNSMIKLDLSNNSFSGVIPLSMFTMPSLVYLILDDNQFTVPLNIRNASSSRLEVLSLNGNKLYGQIPRSISKLAKLRSLFLGSNNLTGDFEFSIFSKLNVLDVSNNGLSGTLPQCFPSHLLQLNMRRNNILGSIPESCADECNLEMLTLASNHLRGKVPQSLTKCRELRMLDLGHNQLVDTFPSSLQALPKLAVLSLRRNKFYGPIWNPSTFWGFVDLHIFDISSNDFNGEIPSDYFRNWSALNAEPVRELHYRDAKDGYYQYYSLTLMAHHINVNRMMKFFSILKVIDLSNNNFLGDTPDSIGEIPSLIVLNLSANGFTGSIPIALGRLTELESLDLSRNKLSGRIPEQLANLTSLAYLSLSYNQLTGPIPQGSQFNTSDNSSYEGNLGLCGPPLSKKCEKLRTHTSISKSGEEGFDWKSILIGYGCGLVIGIVAQHFIVSKRIDRFMETSVAYIRSHMHKKNKRGHSIWRLIDLQANAGSLAKEFSTMSLSKLISVRSVPVLFFFFLIA